jgi:hypothetical protein
MSLHALSGGVGEGVAVGVGPTGVTVGVGVRVGVGVGPTGVAVGVGVGITPPTTQIFASGSLQPAEKICRLTMFWSQFGGGTSCWQQY